MDSLVQAMGEADVEVKDKSIDLQLGAKRFLRMFPHPHLALDRGRLFPLRSLCLPRTT